MAIVSSKIVEERVQIDGRVYITEIHTTDTGVVIPVTYLAEARDNHEARMLARVPELEAALVKEAEDAAAALLLEAANAKLDTWVLTQSDDTVKRELTVTDAELDALRKERGKEEA